MATRPTSTVFLLPLLLLSFSASAAVREESQGSTRNRRLGYFYSRSRGSCTPLFWSSRRESWPSKVLPDSAVASVFGTVVSEHHVTLLESAGGDADAGGAFSQLLRQGTAALLNSYARPGFPYAAWEVKTLLVQGMASCGAAEAQARRFAAANENCD
ncbi:hypothetical protein MLD38_033082 [Melastoma candidum]|uniref:Uncharacterized protein n=1 Tax=Melastoma candidum TaxID=119954 RepID=A0ACB9M614_9MYRT|nr:hypothetical protein MLD38_033082 [Melastoma candidum]